jgi:Fic family protein
MKTPRQPKEVRERGQLSAKANPESTLALAPEDSSWPSITYEERRLDDVDEELQAYGSNRERKLSKGPYRAAITPEIAEIPSIDIPSEVAALAAEASVEIARFDQEIGSEFANFTSILLRSESASSSQIENLTAGAKAIALAEIGDTSKRNASMIVANTTAMNRALELADRLDEESIISMHEALLGDTNSEWTGHWRTDQVRIGGASVHTARFVPPHQDRMAAAMTDLVQFIHRLDIPTFEMAAVAHAQFETIHPFPDGNGRVGRALIHAIFKNRELTHNVTVPVSAGLLSDTDAYFDSLNDYRSGNPVTIIELMARASFAAIDNGRNLAADLQGYEEDWRGRLKARSDSSAWKVANLVLRHPAIDSSLVQSELSIAQRAADRSIGQLVDVGILTEVSGYKRNRRWVAVEVVNALDAFAKRAGKRRTR